MNEKIGSVYHPPAVAQLRPQALMAACGVLVVLAWLALLARPAGAAEEQVSAYELIDSTTSQVMEVVGQAADYVDEDPDRYYQELQDILDEVVDFSGFARGVMGPYAGKQRYESLSSEGKAQLREQASRFSEVMRLGLVRTYGKGLLAFAGSRVELQRPSSESADSNKASITQLIYNDSPEPYVILYQMRRDSDGVWKLRNLIVEAVNLGQVYRNQFQAAARDYEGNLDLVIDNWSVADDVSGD